MKPETPYDIEAEALKMYAADSYDLGFIRGLKIGATVGASVVLLFSFLLEVLF
jgi:hypothetical protein